MRLLLPATLITSQLAGADLSINVEVPRMQVAEYHRPYVAIWIDGPSQTFTANLAVWYDQQAKKTEAGTTWLKDLRQWWRKSGRDLKMPVDGISGATRPPGTHPLTISGSTLSSLKPGSYELVVEAAREVGGRELLRIPFTWPATSAQTGKAQGQHELGAVSLNIKP